MKKSLISLAVVLLVAATLGLVAEEGQEGSWTGEVLDLACYVSHEAHGADHAGCAKKCVQNGQPMGLLTADGDVFLLAADHGNGDPYASLKDLGGERAEVTGVLSEKGGMKMITVKGAKAAG